MHVIRHCFNRLNTKLTIFKVSARIFFQKILEFSRYYRFSVFCNQYKMILQQKAGIEEEYKKLLDENKLFFTIDLVKEQLDKAYKANSERGMKIHINRIIRTCKATENKHFIWFAKLLEEHMKGIISHARVHISSGKVEGTNQMIKTLRRKGYGYPDDEYFFLKIIDASRKFT